MTYDFSIRALIFIGILFSNISCESVGDKKEIINIPLSSRDSLVSNYAIEKETIDTIIPKGTKINLKKVKTVEVLSINKEIKEDTLSENYIKYRLWILTVDQIKFIIRKFEQTTSEEQYLSYAFPRCRITGEIKIDHRKFRYWIGAGATLTLKNSDTTLFFGYSGKKWAKYFIFGKLTKSELEQ